MLAHVDQRLLADAVEQEAHLRGRLQQQAVGDLPGDAPVALLLEEGAHRVAEAAAHQRRWGELEEQVAQPPDGKRHRLLQLPRRLHLLGVVQPAAQHLEAEVHRRHHLDGVVVHVGGNAAALLLLGIHDARQQPAAALVGATQRGERLVELGGALAHPRLQHLAMLPVLLLQPGAAQRVAHRDEHLVGVERLGDVAECAGLERLPGDVRVAQRGHHDDGHVGQVGADVVQQGDPRLAGHGDVAEDQVGHLLGEQGAGLRAARRLPAGVLVALQDAAQQGAHLGVVVDHQDHGASTSRTVRSRAARENGFSRRVTPESRVPLEASTGWA